MKKFTINISAAAKQALTSSAKAEEERKQHELKQLTQRQQEQEASSDDEITSSNKRQKIDNHHNSTTHQSPLIASIETDSHKSEKNPTDGADHDDDDDDDDWGPTPLLPLPKLPVPQLSQLSAINNQTQQNDDLHPSKKRPLVDWDDQDDYSEDDSLSKSTEILPFIPHPSSTTTSAIVLSTLNTLTKHFILMITHLPHLFSFSTAISYPLPDSKNIVSLTTSPVDQFNRQTQELTTVPYSSIMFDPALFSNLLLHSGSSNGVITSIDFSQKIHPSVTFQSRPEKLISIHKIISISHYNPNPTLFTYEKSAHVEQHKIPMHLLVIGNTNQFFALGKGHEIISTSKAGFPLRIADREPGHIAPIREITYAPGITPTLPSMMGQLSRHFDANPINRDFVQANTTTWKQSYFSQIGRTHVWTGGDDSLVRLWSMDIPTGERLEGHMQYFIEKQSIEVYKLNVNPLTNSLTGPIAVQIYPYHQLPNENRVFGLINGQLTHDDAKFNPTLAEKFPKPTMMLYYDYSPSTKLRITTICPISSKYVLIGTKGGLLFCLDTTRNTKESIWVITPPQYLPLSSLSVLPSSTTQYDTQECTIAFNDFIEVKHIAIISPTQAFIIISGDFSLGFILDLTDFDRRPNSKYYNQYTVFYYPELEITSVLPSYSYHLPTQYNTSKLGSNCTQPWDCPVSHYSFQQQQQQQKKQQGNSFLPNYDGLLCGYVISAVISREIKTRYNTSRKAYQQEQQLQLQNHDNDNQQKNKQKEEETKVAHIILPQIKEELDQINQNDIKLEINTSGEKFIPTSSFVQAMKEMQDKSINNDENLESDDDNDNDKSKALKIYTIDELDQLAQHDEQVKQDQVANQATPQFFSLQEYCIDPTKRHCIQQTLASRPGYDHPTPLPLSKMHINGSESWFEQPMNENEEKKEKQNQHAPPSSILETLIHDMTHTATTDSPNGNTYDNFDEDNGKLTENSSFIFSLSLNIPPLSQLSSFLRQEASSTSTSTEDLLSQAFNTSIHPILLPTIDSVSHFPNRPIYSLTWYKQMLLAGGTSAIFLLPNLNLLSLISFRNHQRSSSIAAFNPKVLQQQFSQRLLSQLTNIFLSSLQSQTSHQIEDKPPTRGKGKKIPPKASGPQKPS